ncbi:IS4 transposase [Halogranum amylolyticum]|uniref:IS4 transposase n=1 Tax=Halogranum amylolyticum TaxID=660520 RepID=A0A1H8UCF4_9EURY|nr:transposase [Halogranum amylolyticum]SEP00563.1 IS4 transposase [Halogranum amylolyticum]
MNRTLEQARTSIEQQAFDLLETVNDATSLASQFELGSLNIYEDRRAGWHHKYSLEALVRVMYVREFTGYPWKKLHDHISEDGRAIKLGFDPQKFANGQSAPARTTLSRAWNEYFGPELKRYISNTATWVLELAHEQGNPLGMRSLEPEDKSDVSEVGEKQYTRKKIREVTQEMKQLAYPAIELGRPDEETRYHDNAFLDLCVLMSLQNLAAEDGTTIYGDTTTRENGSPDGDTVLHWFKQLKRKKIVGFVDDCIGRMIKPAKRHLEFTRPADVAIDITYLAYYPDKDEVVLFTEEDEEMVQGTPDSKEYELCYKIATCCIVGENVKFTLGVEPVPLGHSMGKIVRSLIWKAKKHVSIDTVYADRGFDAADVIRSLNEAGVDYVIPRRKTSRVKNFIRQMEHEVEVEQNYAIYGDIDGDATNARAETNFVAVPKRNANEDDDKVEETIGFVTNKDVDDEIRLDRVEAKGIVDRYRRRWGIENSYRSIKQFLAWTTSKEYSVRLFYFAFAVLLYNMWLLVDFLVQVSLDNPEEYRRKPRMTAKRFLNVAIEEVGVD